MSRPSQQLSGVTLDGGWVVGTVIKPRPTATGGHFSTGYHVSHPDGRRGFLKAMDFSEAFHAPNFIDQMKVLVDAYSFERDICLKCEKARVTRVVHALAFGSYVGPLGNFSRVEYLIFELADGDVRAFLDRQSEFDVAFALRTLHGAAAALNQMHTAEMAHQDLKPSNVLVFSPNGDSKLGDLGRSWAKGIPAPHDSFRVAGDQTYAPMELLYGISLDESSKRFGYDLYLLGSLVVFLFARVTTNSLLNKHLSAMFSAGKGASFAEALPYLKQAFPIALDEFARNVPEQFRGKLSGPFQKLL